jgi:hypothetical protein
MKIPGLPYILGSDPSGTMRYNGAIMSVTDALNDWLRDVREAFQRENLGAVLNRLDSLERWQKELEARRIDQTFKPNVSTVTTSPGVALRCESKRLIGMSEFRCAGNYAHTGKHCHVTAGGTELAW